MTGADLREWIAIFQMELTPDGAGGSMEVVPAGLVADRPANVRTPTPRLVFAGDQIADRVQEIVTIRYEPDITSSYRVMWRDTFYDITAVRNIDNADTWLELTCQRLEAGAQ
jgi:head-tail adaptor